MVIYCNERFRGVEAVRDFVAAEDGAPIEVDLQTADAGNSTRFLHFSMSRHVLPDLGSCTVLVSHT